MPATNKYRVALSEQQRQQLERAVASNENSPRERIRARILLLADANQDGGPRPDTAICEAVAGQRGASLRTVHRVRHRFCEVCRGCAAAAMDGMDGAAVESVLKRREQPRRKRCKLDEAATAQLFALASGGPPTGYPRWSLALLARALVENGLVDYVSPETVRQTLRKRQPEEEGATA